MCSINLDKGAICISEKDEGKKHQPAIPLTFTKYYEDHQKSLKQSCKIYSMEVIITFGMIVMVILALIAFIIFFRDASIEIKGWVTIPNFVTGIIGGSGLGGLLMKFHKDINDRFKQSQRDLESFTKYVLKIAASEALINEAFDEARRYEELIDLKNSILRGHLQDDVQVEPPPSEQKRLKNIIPFTKSKD